MTQKISLSIAKISELVKGGWLLYHLQSHIKDREEAHWVCLSPKGISQLTQLHYFYVHSKLYRRELDDTAITEFYQNPFKLSEKGSKLCLYLTGLLFSKTIFTPAVLYFTISKDSWEDLDKIKVGKGLRLKPDGSFDVLEKTPISPHLLPINKEKITLVFERASKALKHLHSDILNNKLYVPTFREVIVYGGIIEVEGLREYKMKVLDEILEKIKAPEPGAKKPQQTLQQQEPKPPSEGAQTPLEGGQKTPLGGGLNPIEGGLP